MKYFENSKFNISSLREEFHNYLKNSLNYNKGYAHQVMVDIFEMVAENYQYDILFLALDDADPSSFTEVCESVEWGDSIHGSGSGSYTMNRYKAIQNLSENFEEAFRVIVEYYPEETHTQVPEWIVDCPEQVDVLVRYGLVWECSRVFHRWWYAHAIVPFCKPKE